MPVYKIKAPDGKTYRVPGPEGASQQDIEQELLRQNPDAGRPATSAYPVGEELPGIIKGAAKGLVKGFTQGMLEGEGGGYRPMGTPKDTRLSAAMSWKQQKVPEGEAPPPTATQKLLQRYGMTEKAPVSEFIGGMMTMPGGERPAAAAISKMAGASAKAGMEAMREKAGQEAAQVPVVTEEMRKAAKSAFTANITLSPKYGGSGLRQAAAGGAGAKNVADVAANRNVPHIDRVAKVEIGATSNKEMEEELPTVLGRKKAEAYKPYEDARGMGPLPDKVADGSNHPGYAAYLVEVSEAGKRFANYSASYGGGPRKGFEAVSELRQHYLNTGANATADHTVSEIQALREHAAANLKEYNTEKNALGVAQRQIADAMEKRLFDYAQRLERGDPNAVAWAQQNMAFRDRSFVRGLSGRLTAARTQLAKLHAVEDSLTPDNHVDAIALARRQATKGDLTGGLADIASWGAHFRDDVRPVIGKGDPSNWSRMDFLLGGTGLVSGHFAFTVPALAKPGLKAIALGGQGKLATKEPPGAISKAVSKAAATKPGQYVIKGTKEATKAAVRQDIMRRESGPTTPPETPAPAATPEAQ